jgi:hypothetical protein
MLAVAWVAAQFVLIAIWSWRRSRLWARTVWVGFVALPVLFTLSLVVVTPRERIIAACEHLAASVEAGDVSAIDQMLADDFEVEGLDRDAFIERVEQTLTRYRVRDISLRQFGVTFPRKDVGVVEFHATAHVRSPELVHDWLASRWRLTFRRNGDTWRLTGIKSVPAPPLNLGELRGWLR